MVTLFSVPTAQRGDTFIEDVTTAAEQEIQNNATTPPIEDSTDDATTEDIVTSKQSATERAQEVVTTLEMSETVGVTDKDMTTGPTDGFTIPSELGKTSTAIETTELPPLPDIHDGIGNRPVVTTPNPNAVTTLPLTNIETDAVTTLTEQERQENTTTHLINDATDLATDATEDSSTVGETDIFTEIQTSNAGIASSTAEDIVSITTAQTGLVTHMLVTELTTATASEDITEVVTDVVLTTGALDITEAREVVTETVSLEVSGTWEVGTTLETDTVGETDVDMTSVVELESAVPTDEVTIPPGPEKTSAAIETTEDIHDSIGNRHDQGNFEVTTPSPNAVTTLPLTNIETDAVTTATEQERPENATTPPIKNATDLATDATKDSGIASSTTEDIMTKPAKTSAAIATRVVPTAEIAIPEEVITLSDLEQAETFDVTTKRISAEQIQSKTMPSTAELPMHATSNESQPSEPLQTTFLQTTVPTTELTTRTSTPLATTKRKVISAPRHMEASEMTEDEMKNVISLQFKGITVSNVIVSFRYESC